MGKRSVLRLMVPVLLLVSGSFALAAQDSKKIDKAQCLACHGPFEKIVKATENWQVPGGDKTSPHRYVPHDTQDAPECTECHTPHTIPLQDKSTVVKPKDIEFCYNACHHVKNLQPCKSCH